MQKISHRRRSVELQWIRLAVFLGLLLLLALGLFVTVQNHPGDVTPRVIDAHPGAQNTIPDGMTVFHGSAFDTCATPALSTMRAWASSPYRAVGIYYAGRGRGCLSQKHLSKAWVREVDRAGWKILPIFVGSQAPCVSLWHKRDTIIDPEDAEMGAHEAAEAVAAAGRLGIMKGSALYLDMESYNKNDTQCAETTINFIRKWSRGVRELGYLPGFYSSADSGVRHLRKARDTDPKDMPEAIWFARWRVDPSLTAEPALGLTSWPHNRRIHQYAGDIFEEHGGVGMRINASVIHAPVATLHAGAPSAAPHPVGVQG
ncbi:DUF1906 domain-containing protein [Streptomyces sp. NPDC003038]|uniref:DUF1906 domain-containing protein n=1 Tax=unclassified Streptomyces TaxID=2593676 RepID=UPI0033B79526